jgi:hypothetical protein
MTKQCPVNNMNKYNWMTIMMKIFFNVDDGKKKIFFCIGMYMILICLFINIWYLQFLFSFMPSCFMLCPFFYITWYQYENN